MPFESDVDGRPRTSRYGEPDPLLEAHYREWMKMPSIASPETVVHAWACVRGAYQYVLTFNTQTGNWALTAKHKADATRTRIDLGWRFETREQAEQACEQHQEQNKQ